MSVTQIGDYLTKQLFIERNIVTFRSLSRELSIHVNAAKNALLAYYTDASSSSGNAPPCATYVITGEATMARQNDDFDMDLDTEKDIEDESNDEDDDVMQLKVLLVGEAGLEDAKSSFSKINSIHVYSLSPSPIRDAGLICAPTPALRQIDNDGGPELGLRVGKIVGAEIKWVSDKKTPAIASSSKSLASLPPKTAPKDEQVDKGKEKAPVKPKATGKLDWSKAKSKETKQEEAKEAEKKVAKEKGEKMEKEKREKERRELERQEEKRAKEKQGKERKEKEKLEKEKREEKNNSTKQEAKRGTKRKNVLLSDEEMEEAPVVHEKPSAKPHAGARVKKGVVLSDDEEELPKARVKGKAKARDSDTDRSLKAMMDVDDDLVIRASRSHKEEEEEEENEEAQRDENSDVDMDVDDVKPKPRARKPRKVIPVGRNGLKKRRVVKSKTRFDDKGYMVTEDYSEYESVDEEELQPTPPVKTKGKAGTTSKAVNETTGSSKGKAKETGKKSGGSQKSLINFFGPGKVKK